MDSNRFDVLVISLSSLLSRRGMLATATGLAALAGSNLGPSLDTEARRKRKKKGKKKKKKKCKNGKTKCNGSCVNTSQDSQNCGSCGNSCQSGTTCQSGSCKNQNNVCPTECCSTGDCPNGFACQNGACQPQNNVCPTECCENSDCPTGGTCNQQTGQCVCPGNCCFNDDCAPNQACLNVNNVYNCFCKPELVCGQVCCPANLRCINPGTSSCGV